MSWFDVIAEAFDMINVVFNYCIAFFDFLFYLKMVEFEFNFFLTIITVHPDVIHSEVRYFSAPFGFLPDCA